MPADEPIPTDDGVDALFDDFLARLEKGEEEDFERFVARHPEHADALRRLHAQWTRLDSRVDEALPEPVDDGPEDPLAGAPPLPDDLARRPIAAEPGTRIGDYRLVTLLGQGGMGQVWEAEQVSLGRRVALKLVRPGRETQRIAALFEREARAGGRLSHPGLVAVHAAGETDGIHYIAQEFVPGARSLADYVDELRDEPQLHPGDYRDVAALFARVADAVHVAHEAGVLHRDLKPQNILLAPDRAPKVTDFGLAHVTDESSLAARPGLIGTLPYMSPEQVGEKAGRVDRRADVFSLGAVLYEALTQRRAFAGDSAPQILTRILSHDPPDPRTFRSRVPEALAVICAHALEKDPDARYPTMAALADDLRRFLASEPIHARPEGLRSRAHKWIVRHPTWSSSLGLGAVALLVISILLVREVDARRDAEREAARADANAGRAADAAALAEQRARQLQAASDLANLRAALSLLDQGNHAAALAMLRACSPPRRGWVWRHSRLRADPSLATLEGGAGALVATAASADGRHVVAAGADGALVGWDTASGERTLRLAGDGPAPTALALTADGARLVTGDEAGGLLVRERATGAVVRRIEAHDKAIRAVAVSADGSRALSGSRDGAARLWDLATGAMVAEPLRLNRGIASVALSADGRLALIGTQLGTVTLWDEALEPPGETLRFGYGEGPVAVALSADGALAVAGRENGTLQTWDVATRAERLAVPVGALPIVAVAASADGARLLTVSADDDGAQLWDAHGGEPLGRLVGHEGRVLDGRLADGGRLAVTTSADGTARLWDGATGRAHVALPDPGHAISALACSADGRALVSASLESERLSVWDGRTGAVRARLAGHELGLTTVAISDDARRAASGSYDGTARIWDLEAGRALHVLPGHRIGVTSVALSGDGRRLVSGAYDGTVRLWDARRGTLLAVLAGDETFVTSVAIDRAGRLAAAAFHDASVRTWDLERGTSATLETPHPFADTTLALSADGERLVTGSLQDDTARVWSARTLEPLARLAGHRVGVHALAIDATGQRVVTVSTRDVALRVWDGTSGEALASLRAHEGPVHALDMAGSRIVSAGADHRILVWESDLDALRALWRGADARRTARAAGPPAPHAPATEEPDARDLDRAWRIARQAGGSPGAYRRVLRQARAALPDHPEDPDLLRTLGVALLRLDRAREARDTILLAADLYAQAGRTTDRATTMLFLALAHDALGERAEAREIAAQARRALGAVPGEGPPSLGEVLAEVEDRLGS